LTVLMHRDSKESQQGTLHCQRWDLATGKAVGPPLDLPARVQFRCFSADGRRLVTLQVNEKGDPVVGDITQVWDVEGRRAVTPLRPSVPTQGVPLSLDGRMVLTLDDKNAARVWDTVTATPISPPVVHVGSGSQPGGYAVFSRDGRQVVTASRGELRV